MAKTIEQLQEFVNRKPDIREVINEVVDFLQANPGGDPLFPAGTKIYLGNLTQFEGGDPEDGNDGMGAVNTLAGGAIVYTRNSAGDYTGTSTGSFTAGKTFFIGSGYLDEIEANGLFLALGRLDNNSFSISTRSFGNPADSFLGNTLLLILVLP